MKYCIFNLYLIKRMLLKRHFNFYFHWNTSKTCILMKKVVFFNSADRLNHRHLKISTACLVCYISTVNGHCNKKKKKKKKLTLGRLALVADTQQTSNNLFWDFPYLWVEPINNHTIFLVKWVPGWGPEQRESEKTVLYLQIFIILISYINIYHY
jgi:hypothetical protein